MDLQKIDERSYMDAVLATGGFEPHFIEADRLGPLSELNKVLWHMDEPFLAPNLYMHWALYNAAHQQGIRVFLDGTDGDTTVSYGLEYLAELAQTGKWSIWRDEARSLSRRIESSFSTKEIIWRYGFRPLIPEPLVQFWRALRGRSKPERGAKRAINPAFAQRFNLVERSKVRARHHHFQPVQIAREQHWRSLTAGLLPYTLEVADKAAAAFSLEGRYPFFDRRLVEFCKLVWVRKIVHFPEELRFRVGLQQTAGRNTGVHTF